MGCAFNSLDFSIFKDKIIVLAIIWIIMLSILLIFMVKSDTSLTPVTNNSTELNHKHTKNITRWTLIPIDGTCSDSAFGGTGLNGSTHGSCYMCNCTSVSEYDI